MKMSKFQLPRLRALTLLALGLMMLFVFVPKNTYAATSLQGSDFQAQSFSKTVDYYDYVRAYAQSQGYNITEIQNQHAYIYTTYVNVGGFQLFYAGLLNATHNNMNVTVPIQTVFEHFKTPGGKDAITASSFLSLVAFQEGSNTIFPNSPDRNDTVYASFSLGYPLTAFGTHPVPTYIANSQIIPLTSTDSNHWTWGLNYTNLNAIWWRVYPDPLLAPLLQWNQSPQAFAQYSQLSFTYSLAIDPTAKTATLTTSYTIGQMTDLYVLTGPQVLHYNATGTYNLNGQPRPPGITLYQFLAQGGYKLSIVQSHMAVLASTTTTDSTDQGSSVDNDTQMDVSNTAVNTVANGGEKVFKTNFGAKPSYQLYNSTSGATATYSDNVRTVSRPAWGANPVYQVQNAFMGFLPLFVYHVDPSLFTAARTGMASFRISNYLYIISYPTWGGYKIVNDPQYTTFYQPAGSGLALLTMVFIAIAVAAGIGGVFAFLFRRKRTAAATLTGSTAGPVQSTGPVGPSGPSQ